MMTGKEEVRRGNVERRGARRSVGVAGLVRMRLSLCFTSHSDRHAITTSERSRTHTHAQSLAHT